MAKVLIAGVQMDCRLMDVPANLDAIQKSLRQAASQGARLVILPECVTTGYCFTSKDEAWPFAETIPGPTTEALTAMCRENNVHAVIGMLEAAGNDLFNAAVLIGPQGVVTSYRKVHLPFLGVDRFTTSGSRPFAVHEIDGLRVGMLVCYDSSFPEASRCLMLAGADLIVLPTNWPIGAANTAKIVPVSRALENHVYFAALNRVGTERGTPFIGRSSIANPWGEVMVEADDAATILYATVDTELARSKHIVVVPGAYELDRLKDRRPAMYGPITAT